MNGWEGVEVTFLVESTKGGIDGIGGRNLAAGSLKGSGDGLSRIEGKSEDISRASSKEDLADSSELIGEAGSSKNGLIGWSRGVVGCGREGLGTMEVSIVAGSSFRGRFGESCAFL